MRNKLLVLFISLLLIITFKAFSTSKPKNVSATPKATPSEISSELNVLSKKANHIDPKALKLALNAYHNAKQKGLVKNPYLTVIDYSKASNQKRLWVIDMAHHSVPFNTYVAHGKNSGLTKANHFSNSNGSHATSIGVFLTGPSYVGHHVGYAMGLRGLERGVNDNASRRAVVVHGARYMDESFIKHNGRAGRSWGCPSIPTALVKPLINVIKNGSVLFAYYPDTSWLSHSRFLGIG